MPGKVKQPFRHKNNNNIIKNNLKQCDKPKVINKSEENLKIKSDLNDLNENTNSITLAGYCAVCYNKANFFCSDCKLIGYCCYSHMANHWLKHQQLCEMINNKICNKKEYVYNLKINNPDEWRFIRVKTLEKIKSQFERELLPHERDVILFPKHCQTCYETDINKLEICRQCHQIWYCRSEKSHLRKNHKEWCEKLQLFSTLVKRQAKGNLFMFDMNFESYNQLKLNSKDNIESVILNVLNNPDNLDACNIAMISQAVTNPLTILHALNLINYKVQKNVVIHLIGAELHFEGKVLQAWENFFTHFCPDIQNLKIIMIGPELNADKSYEKIRLCKNCETKNKSITIEYKDNQLYHQYASSKNYSKPNLVCAFNPGFHRTTGYSQTDTWPLTIKSAVKNNCPFIFTAYTAFEAPLDLQRVQESALVHIIHKTGLNPFASLKPDRNFISDQDAPLIFKNYYLSIVTAQL